jgi:hypothetical protein
VLPKRKQSALLLQVLLKAGHGDIIELLIFGENVELLVLVGCPFT